MLSEIYKRVTFDHPHLSLLPYFLVFFPQFFALPCNHDGNEEIKHLHFGSQTPKQGIHSYEQMLSGYGPILTVEALDWQSECNQCRMFYIQGLVHHTQTQSICSLFWFSEWMECHLPALIQQKAKHVCYIWISQQCGNIGLVFDIMSFCIVLLARYTVKKAYLTSCIQLGTPLCRPLTGPGVQREVILSFDPRVPWGSCTVEIYGPR